MSPEFDDLVEFAEGQLLALALPHRLTKRSPESNRLPNFTNGV